MKNWHIKILLGAVIVSCTALSSDMTEAPNIDIKQITYIKIAKQKLESKQMFFRFVALAGAGLVIYNFVYTNNIESFVLSKGTIPGIVIAVAATGCDDILTTRFKDHCDRAIDYNRAQKQEDLSHLYEENYKHKPYKYPHTRLASWFLGLFGLGRTSESVRLARVKFSGNGTGPEVDILRNQTLEYFGLKDKRDLLFAKNEL